MVKKYLRIIGVLSMVFVLLFTTACGNGKNGDTDSAENAADNFPNTSLELTIPFAAGDGTDLCARIYSEALEKELGQPVVCVNREGGGGAIGAAEAAKKDATGYYLLHGTISTTLIQPNISELGYEEDSFIPVAQLTANALGLAASVDAPYSTVEELVEYAKEHPGELRYGTPGNGSLQHIMWEAFCQEQGISMTMLPYDGGNSALSAVVSGEADLAFVGATVLLSQYQAGTVKVLGETGEERLDSMPDVPSFVEQGYDYTPLSWGGVFVPAGTPDEIVEKLSDALETVANTPEVQEQWEKVNLTPAFLNHQDFATKVADESKEIRQVLDTLGMSK